MKTKPFLGRPLAFLLSTVAVTAQLPAFALDSQVLAQNIADAAPVKVRATQEVNPELSNPVLTGHVSSDVESLSKAILHDEINLERFCLNYRLNAAKQGAWKGRRFFIGQETDLVATDAALITGTASHFAHIHHGGGSANVYANGALLPYAVGNCFAGGEDALELGINGYHSWEAGKNGYGSKYARDHVVKLVASIDQKLAQRERLIREQPASDAELAELQQLEGRVLADFRDIGVAKFEKIHTGAKKTLASQNSFYLLDIVTKTTGAIGAFDGMHAYLQGRGGYVVPCGIFNIVSGGFIIVNPVLSKLAGDMARNADQRNLEKHGLPKIKLACDQLDTDWDHLAKFSKNHQVHERPELGTLVGRLDAYDSGHRCLVDEISDADAAARKGRKTSIQGLAKGTLVGASLSTFGIGVTIAGAKYLHDAIRFNSNIAWSYLELTPFITYAALDNLNTQVHSEIAVHNQAKEHKLPGQLIQKRLDELNKIDKSI